MEKINALLEKFNYFRLDQFDSIEKPTEDTIRVTLVVQNDDGEDTHQVKLTFNNIKEARLLDNNTLGYLDMMSGVSIIKEHDLYGFAIGACPAMLNVLNAPFYIVASEIEIEEIVL